MVRIKNRYLLVNILYPDSNTSNIRTNKPAREDDVPFSVQFRQPSSDQLTIQLLLRTIRNSVADVFGDYGSGKVSTNLQSTNNITLPTYGHLIDLYLVKYWSPATSTAIIRVSRDHYRLVWAALSFVTQLPRPVDQNCLFQVVRVSGTIRKAEEEAIRRARISIRRAQGPKNASLLTTSGALDKDHDYDMMVGIEDPDEEGDLDDESD